MSINDNPSCTQAFVVSATAPSSNIYVDREVSSISQNDQPLTQAFTTVSPSTLTPLEATVERDLITPKLNIKTPELVSIPSTDTTVNKLHPTVTFSLAPTPIQNRPGTSAIQPQVTSNDVQQMLLTFSPDPSSMNEEQQPQPMEEDSQQSEQQHQQQRPTFSMSSSTESTASTEA